LIKKSKYLGIEGVLIRGSPFNASTLIEWKSMKFLQKAKHVTINLIPAL
jgi:hypothetical protein